MATLNLTRDALESTIETNPILIIDFWASWCGPCLRFAPTFEAASEANEDICFAKVNTEEQQELAGMFGVRSIPTLAVFRDGILIYKEAGALPPAAFDQLIEQVKGVDMDDVRRQIAESETQAASPDNTENS